MERILFWESNEKHWENGKYYGSIIDPEQVYDGVDLGNYRIRVWADVPGNKEIKLPDIIIWQDEEYNTVNEIDWDHHIYLDALVGAEGVDYSDTYISSDNILAFDYEENCFGNLNDFITVKCYNYFKNTNLTTVTADENTTEYNFEILDTYNLDYFKPNSTNAEYGGMGEHAKLHKVKDGDQEYLLMHNWSQWQGSELDSGYLLTESEALEELENHPEIEKIQEWLNNSTQK